MCERERGKRYTHRERETLRGRERENFILQGSLKDRDSKTNTRIHTHTHTHTEKLRERERQTYKERHPDT